MNEFQRVGRLAMRQEGESWVAYYAMPDSMEGAVWLGSIRMTIAQHPERKAMFMELMRETVADLIEEQTGMRPSWGGAQLAPEHERAGSA